MKKQIGIAFILIFIGLAGLIACFIAKNSQDIGQNYYKEWNISANQTKNLQISSGKDTDLRVKRTSDNKVRLRVEGKMAKAEVKDLKALTGTKNAFHLTLGTKHNWLEKWHRPHYGVQKVTLLIPESMSLGELKADLNKANVRLDKVQGKKLAITIYDGEVIGSHGRFDVTKIDTKKSLTDLSYWDGTISMFSEKGDQFLKDSSGNFTLQNQSGLSQVHRHGGTKGEILNFSGKVIATESHLDHLTINSTEGTEIVQGLRGDLLLSTKKGKSILRDNRGEQLVSSENGDVIVSQTHLMKKMNVKSKKGLIKLTLNKSYQKQPITINAPLGSVESDFHWQSKQKNARIVLTTTKGEIKVFQEE
ncbi:DUF4097 family beta strand repeat-containing protein [Listeria aquatica]|uniref:DUF4097 family beta strand repeat-containing protein n=1 Tax=Listeria aquatica TaxID=1494960 RepID=UPI003EF2E459